MNIPQKQVRELDKLRQTIEDYQKQLRVPSSPVLFKSHDDIIVSSSRTASAPSEHLEGLHGSYQFENLGKTNSNEVTTTSTKRQTLREYIL